ncbi:MAG: DUF362 domain-containing protein [Deltaproteobacteria bacterium]
MEKVILIKCDSYDQDEVSEAMDKVFEHLGGIDKYIKKDNNVFIKSNLLMKKKPADAVTTHPVIIEEIAKRAAAAGADVVIGDSPGGFYNEDVLKGVYSSCGYNGIKKADNIRLNYNTSSKEVAFENGRVAKRLTIIEPAADADLIINVPKIKTHMMMTYTGAVKNLFGLIPGALKAEYHLRMKDTQNFAQLLVDICECSRPQLSIMDAVIGMEGEGPSAGKPRKVGLIIASTNPYALDVAASHIIGIKPNEIPTVKAAKERGLPANIKEIEIVGEDITNFIIKDFKLPDSLRDIRFSKNKVFGFLTEYLKPKLIFDREKCIACKRCMNHCPAKAVVIEGKQPVVDLSKCIRCFCCHELCPQKAIEIKKNWILKTINKN